MKTVAGLYSFCGITNGVGTAARLSSVHALSIDTALQVVYIAENIRLVKFDIASGIRAHFICVTFSSAILSGLVSQVVNAGSGNSIWAVASSADGSVLYVTFSFSVSSVTTAGMRTLLAGNSSISGYSDGTGTNALFGILYSIVCSAGTLFATDYGNHLIRTISTLGL